MRSGPLPSYTSSIVDVILGHATARPNALALVFESGRGEAEQLTYGELAREVRLFAGALQARDLCGKRIALLYAAGPAFVVALLACLATGGVAIPLAPMGRRRERVRNLIPTLDNVAPAAILMDGAMTVQFGSDLAEIAMARDAQLLEHESLRQGAEEIAPVPAEENQLAVLQFTSGSTSSPIGVMVTHGNIIANQIMIERAFGHDMRSDFVGWAPHFHDQGLFGNIIQPLYLGAKCVLTSPQAFIQRPIFWLELISKYRAHTSGGPNFAFDLCVEHVRHRGMPDIDLASWNVAFNGAEPIRAASLRNFAECFADVNFRPEAFLPCYGLAESTLVTVAHPVDRPPETRRVCAKELHEDGLLKDAQSDEKSLEIVSCGPAMEGSEVAIVDTNTGKELLDGRIGEIWLKGRHIAAGYWQRPDATRETFGSLLPPGEEAWLRTGDLGCHEHGRIYVLGRLKDLLIVRGRNYSPADVEQIWSDISGRIDQASSAALDLNVSGKQHIVLIAEAGRSELSNMTEADVQELSRQVRATAIQRLELSITDLVIVPHGAVARTTSGKVKRSETARKLLSGDLPVRFVTGPLSLATASFNTVLAR